MFGNFVCFKFIAFPHRFSILKVTLNVELTFGGLPVTLKSIFKNPAVFKLANSPDISFKISVTLIDNRADFAVYHNQFVYNIPVIHVP